MKIPAVLVLMLSLLVGSLSADTFRHEMRVLPDAQKFMIVDNDDLSRAASPSGLGWYYSVFGVVNTPTGLVACYRRSDSHTAVTTDIMVAYSGDGGKTWEGHHSIAHADVWNEQGCWIAPQISRLADGRLVVIVDFGNRRSGADWPMLSNWQKPNRGMWNYLLWSEDDGKTWSDPIMIDDVGGEPGYITETDSGVLLYTRTESKQSDVLWDPPPPWNDIYYYNSAVLSYDGGDTWDMVVPLAVDPHHGDCEVGTVDLGDGRLMAVPRIGMGGGQYRSPSRLAFSDDGGVTWTGHRLSPFYGHRPVIRKLASGRLLLHYRNRWGTVANYATLFDPDEELPYEPALFAYDESRCRLENGVLTLRTDEGQQNLVSYGFYPAHNPESRVEIEAELKVDEAEVNGANISVGCWVRIEPHRISLGDRPEVGFAIDTTGWRHYRITREDRRLRIFVDGQQRLDEDVTDLLTRDVVVGNRMVREFSFEKILGGSLEIDWQSRAITHWRSLQVRVENPHDYNIDWRWQAADGYPDPFRRNRIIALDKIATHFAHTGYGGSTQLEDGTIVIVDYTVGGNGGPTADKPFGRAYRLTEEMFRSQ